MNGGGKTGRKQTATCRQRLDTFRKSDRSDRGAGSDRQTSWQQAAQQEQSHLKACDWVADAGFYLFAAGYAADAPRAEVFAVVGQQVVAIFAEAGAGAVDGLGAEVAGEGFGLDRHGVARGKRFERGFFDRRGLQCVAEAAIVNDAAAAGVDAMMGVAIARRDQVGARQVGVGGAVSSELGLRMHGGLVRWLLFVGWRQPFRINRASRGSPRAGKAWRGLPGVEGYRGCARQAGLVGCRPTCWMTPVGPAPTAGPRIIAHRLV